MWQLIMHFVIALCRDLFTASKDKRNNTNSQNTLNLHILWEDWP